MLSPCALCAQKGTSCCTGNQILLTSGDIKRMTLALLNDDFYLFEKADDDYIDPGDDPLWITISIRPDGGRRVLKRTDNKFCSLLGPMGCRLPITTRPLVCRLYPVAYSTNWIKGIDSSCPIAYSNNTSTLLDQLGMSKSDARIWHGMLMEELFAEYYDKKHQESSTTSHITDLK